MPRNDLPAFAARHIEMLTEELLANDALLIAEPLVAPQDPGERAAWEQRLRARKAAFRTGLSTLAQLLTVERLAREGPQ